MNPTDGNAKLQSSALRQRIAEMSISQQFGFNSTGFCRDHIFFAIFKRLTAVNNLDCRLRLLHEFSNIEKLVAAARHDDLASCTILRGEIYATRQKAASASCETQEMDALLFPALALEDQKRGNTEAAVRHLEASISILQDLFDSGMEEAEAAILEQQLNILRVWSNSGDRQQTTACALRLFAILVAKEKHSAPPHERCQRLGTDDRWIQVCHYTDEILYKVAHAFPGAALDGFLRLLADASLGWQQGKALQTALQLLPFNRSELDLSTRQFDALVIEFSSLPFTVAYLLNFCLKNSLYPDMTDTVDSVDDALRMHKAYARFSASVEMWKTSRLPLQLQNYAAHLPSARPPQLLTPSSSALNTRQAISLAD